ncbi:MSC_0882 family membrane protein [Spiroplasma eriocheiris]|uniref:Transmembrane protein n=1 Tax=Spiroplasma eriocheiris TaxID=315358 RepID=A0A0H3XHE0_9MOLU|nr:hypothetical protein [Spiroplasma eriocheiris]AHF57634.1 putative transmembrane protein [Spiroplasma eriocheiris CCTCC M 207170]AKM54088.1 hypothetical protein SERIO_v1c05130 [Spiroplasma eriocheiris]
MKKDKGNEFINDDYQPHLPPHQPQVNNSPAIGQNYSQPLNQINNPNLAQPPLGFTNNNEIKDKIPGFIKQKIIWEKFRASCYLLFGLGGIIILAFFITIYYVAKSKGYFPNSQQKLSDLMPEGIKFAEASFANIKVQLIPYPYLLIALLILAVGIFFYGCFELSTIRGEVKRYYQQLQTGHETIPNFVFSIYKKSIVRKIVINWLATLIYLLGLISLGILIALQHAYDIGKKEFILGFWKLGNVKNLKTEITVTSIVLLITLGLHVLSLLLAKRTRGQIISYYGYDIMPFEEMRYLKRKTNWICFLIFLLIITIIIIALVILLRKLHLKKSNKTFLWPWQR